MRAEGLDVTYVHHDVSDEKEWDRVVQATLDRHGRLDVLVNNAGGGGGTAFLGPGSSLEQFRRTMDVNMTGTFLGIRAAVDPMRHAGGGSIINVSSIYGIVGGPGPAGYFASKGGIRTLTKAAAVQLAPHRIRVNSVHPGFCMTPMNEERFSKPEEAQVRLARVPLGRFGTAEEVAWSLVYLASDEAQWVTGQELVIDCGLCAA
jgi:3alpha(or 20beta)-hydroxysteroid dehydrogenase